MLSISTFVIYNGKLTQLERDLEAMSVPEDLCSLSDRQMSLLWLMRDVDREAETTPADSFVQSLFAGKLDVSKNQGCAKNL